MRFNSQLHIVFELSASFALVAGVAILVRHYQRPDSPLLLVGVAFLGTGFLDGLHALITSLGNNRSLSSPFETLSPWS